MLNCRDMTGLVSQSQERELSLTEKISLRLHLLHCHACRNFTRQVPFLRKAMRSFAQRRDEDKGDPS